MSGERHRGTIHCLIWVASGLIAAAVTAIGLTVLGFRSDAVDQAANDAGNIATILAEQTARSVQAIDLTLTELQAHAASRGAAGSEVLYRALRSRETHELLKDP
jgi:hypothetical protein